MLPVFEPVQCDRNAGGEAAFTGSECTRQRICDEENADTGCPRAFRDASRKETKRHGSRNRLVWSRQIVSVYAGIYECWFRRLSWKEGVYDVIGDPKMYRENGKKTYREFDQILRELPRGDRRKSCFRKIKKPITGRMPGDRCHGPGEYYEKVYSNSITTMRHLLLSNVYLHLIFIV